MSFHKLATFIVLMLLFSKYLKVGEYTLLLSHFI